MKGVEDWGGGQCEGGRRCCDKKRPQVLPPHKRWSFLCARGGFPLPSSTGAKLSILATVSVEGRGRPAPWSEEFVAPGQDSARAALICQD